MRAAIIENNLVVNLLEVESLEVLPDTTLVEANEFAVIGGTYKDGVFSLPDIDLEKLAEEARKTRDALLSETDWTQEPNAEANSELWEIYRQELRDISAQEGFPKVIVWPISPSEQV